MDDINIEISYKKEEPKDEIKNNQARQGKEKKRVLVILLSN